MKIFLGKLNIDIQAFFTIFIIFSSNLIIFIFDKLKKNFDLDTK